MEICAALFTESEHAAFALFSTSHLSWLCFKPDVRAGGHLCRFVRWCIRTAFCSSHADCCNLWFGVFCGICGKAESAVPVSHRGFDCRHAHCRIARVMMRHLTAQSRGTRARAARAPHCGRYALE